MLLHHLHSAYSLDSALNIFEIQMSIMSILRLFFLFLSFTSSLGFGSYIDRPGKQATQTQSKTSSRAEFVSAVVAASSLIFPARVVAFDGGVGGLGKTRPQTGVVFLDEEVAASTTQSSSGDVTYELVSPDGTTAFVSFKSPWPLLQTAAGVECRDISGGYESAFIQVAEIQKGSEIKPAQLKEAIFSSKGKFGMYGSPTDIRIKKVDSGR